VVLLAGVVVEEVGGDDGALVERRLGGACFVALVSSSSASTLLPAPSAWLVPSFADRRAREDEVAELERGSRAPQVPTRIRRRAPSMASSVITIAALGPPIPVLWIVSGSSSAAVPV
jgi:hypothetical protein